MQAPQQQRHAAHQIEKNHGSHARLLPAIRVEGSGYRQSKPDQPFNLPKNARVALPLWALFAGPRCPRFGKRSLKTTVTKRGFPLGNFQQFFCKTASSSGASNEQGQGYIC
jgi:hypothetical protein